MSLKNDLKNIVINESVSGPFVSMFLPLYPNKDNYKFDDTEFNSLLSKAKKQYVQNFGEKGWTKYEERINNAKDEIVFDYAQSKSLALIIGKDTTYHYYLPRKVDLQVRVNESPYILPIIGGYEFMPTYNIARISRSGFEMFKVKNGLVFKKNLDADAPTSAEKALNIDSSSEKIRMEQRGGSSFDQFRGTDIKSESEQSNTDNYFRIVDEYINKHISLKDHLKVVLMATEADAGEFKKTSHNSYLDREDIIKVPSVINHETLEKATQEINQQFLSDCQQNVEEQVDIARSKKRYLDDIQEIKQAAIEGRLDTLIIKRQIVEDETETEDQLHANEIALSTIIYGGNVIMIDPKILDNHSIIGILRGI